ncbi:MAG: ATP-dependent DNA helicase [Deltaproteobacteria bacterium]|nr:ATP-dependent DNA helicase [Deltaproteobacteria bacterium]
MSDNSKISLRNKIRTILGPEGIMAEAIPEYEFREQQIIMAESVLSALTEEDALIIEAPTGTGKTLAYLVAAALSRKKVVISTGTKNLQEQLFFKDIPFVKNTVFPDLKGALLKGRGNFVCHQRFKNYLRQPSFYEQWEEKLLERIIKWYQVTAIKGDGDRAEIETLPDDSLLWSEICSTAETCLGRNCLDFDRCFVQKMRSKATDVDLVVVNHSLLASDMAVRASGRGEVIPRFDALIVDEAHGFEEAVTQHFGFHSGVYKFRKFVRDCRFGLAEAGVNDDKFEKALRKTEEQAKTLFGIFEEAPLQKIKIDPNDRRVMEAQTNLSQVLSSFLSMIAGIAKVNEELKNTAQRAQDLILEIETIFGAISENDYARWVEKRDRAVTAHACPIEISHALQTRLYEKVPAVVFTSATLATSGSFKYFKSSVGLNGNLSPKEEILDSPFDYNKQTLFYVPESIPEPNSNQFVEVITDKIGEILSVTGGRAFVLFTSTRNMETVFERLKGTLPFPLLLQGTKPKTRLIEEFKSNKGAVLFATSSFWEGVDVQGEALSCVIIDRLPFAPPDDPILSTRVDLLRSAGKNPFFLLQVPMAVIALKQGLGRLIRARNDKGALCVMDTRILSKNYGKFFFESLHKSPLTRSLKALKAFFESRN